MYIYIYTHTAYIYIYICIYTYIYIYKWGYKPWFPANCPLDQFLKKHHWSRLAESPESPSPRLWRSSSCWDNPLSWVLKPGPPRRFTLHSPESKHQACWQWTESKAVKERSCTLTNRSLARYDARNGVWFSSKPLSSYKFCIACFHALGAAEARTRLVQYRTIPSYFLDKEHWLWPQKNSIPAMLATCESIE